MARNRTRTADAHTQRSRQATRTAKRLGKPLPVVSDDEAGWFDAEQDATKAAEQYVRERFVDLLDDEEIERLATNRVMLQIVAEHRDLFVEQHRASGEAA